MIFVVYQQQNIKKWLIRRLKNNEYTNTIPSQTIHIKVEI